MPTWYVGTADEEVYEAARPSFEARTSPSPLQSDWEPVYPRRFIVERVPGGPLSGPGSYRIIDVITGGYVTRDTRNGNLLDQNVMADAGRRLSPVTNSYGGMFPWAGGGTGSYIAPVDGWSLGIAPGCDLAQLSIGASVQTTSTAVMYWGKADGSVPFAPITNVHIVSEDPFAKGRIRVVNMSRFVKVPGNSTPVDMGMLDEILFFEVELYHATTSGLYCFSTDIGPNAGRYNVLGRIGLLGCRLTGDENSHGVCNTKTGVRGGPARWLLLDNEIHRCTEHAFYLNAVQGDSRIARNFNSSTTGLDRAYLGRCFLQVEQRANPANTAPGHGEPYPGFGTIIVEENYPARPGMDGGSCFTFTGHRDGEIIERNNRISFAHGGYLVHWTPVSDGMSTDAGTIMPLDGATWSASTKRLSHPAFEAILSSALTSTSEVVVRDAGSSGLPVGARIPIASKTSADTLSLPSIGGGTTTASDVIVARAGPITGGPPWPAPRSAFVTQQLTCGHGTTYSTVYDSLPFTGALWNQLNGELRHPTLFLALDNNTERATVTINAAGGSGLLLATYDVESKVDVDTVKLSTSKVATGVEWNDITKQLKAPEWACVALLSGTTVTITAQGGSNIPPGPHSILSHPAPNILQLAASVVGTSANNLSARVDGMQVGTGPSSTVGGIVDEGRNVTNPMAIAGVRRVVLGDFDCLQRGTKRATVALWDYQFSGPLDNLEVTFQSPPLPAQLQTWPGFNGDTARVQYGSGASKTLTVAQLNGLVDANRTPRPVTGDIVVDTQSSSSVHDEVDLCWHPATRQVLVSYNDRKAAFGPLNFTGATFDKDAKTIQSATLTTALVGHWLTVSSGSTGLTINTDPSNAGVSYYIDAKPAADTVHIDTTDGTVSGAVNGSVIGANMDQLMRVLDETGTSQFTPERYAAIQGHYSQWRPRNSAIVGTSGEPLWMSNWTNGPNDHAKFSLISANSAGAFVVLADILAVDSVGGRKGEADGVQLADGRLLCAWNQHTVTPSTIQCRLFNSDATAIGASFTVGTALQFSKKDPRLKGDASAIWVAFVMGSSENDGWHAYAAVLHPTSLATIKPQFKLAASLAGLTRRFELIQYGSGGALFVYEQYPSAQEVLFSGATLSIVSHVGNVWTLDLTVAAMSGVAVASTLVFSSVAGSGLSAGSTYAVASKPSAGVARFTVSTGSTITAQSGLVGIAVLFTGGSQIYAQAFDELGNEILAPTRIDSPLSNNGTTQYMLRPDIDLSRDGTEAMVCWTAGTTDNIYSAGSTSKVWARSIDMASIQSPATLTPRNEFRIEQSTATGHYWTRVSATGYRGADDTDGGWVFAVNHKTTGPGAICVRFFDQALQTNYPPFQWSGGQPCVFLVGAPLTCEVDESDVSFGGAGSGSWIVGAPPAVNASSTDASMVVNHAPESSAMSIRSAKPSFEGAGSVAHSPDASDSTISTSPAVMRANSSPRPSAILGPPVYGYTFTPDAADENWAPLASEVTCDSPPCLFVSKWSPSSSSMTVSSRSLKTSTGDVDFFIGSPPDMLAEQTEMPAPAWTPDMSEAVFESVDVVGQWYPAASEGLFESSPVLFASSVDTAGMTEGAQGIWKLPVYLSDGSKARALLGPANRMRVRTADGFFHQVVSAPDAPPPLGQARVIASEHLIPFELDQWSMNLSTVARIKALHGATTWTAALDALLATILASVSARAEKYMRRTVQAGLKAEQYTVARFDTCAFLDATPVSSITSVKYARNPADFADATALDASTYVLENYKAGVLRFQLDMNLVDPRRPGYAQVTYTGGMATDVDDFVLSYPDIAGAIAQQALYEFQRRTSAGGNSSSATGSTSYTGDMDWLPAVLGVLNTYRRHVV